MRYSPSAIFLLLLLIFPTADVRAQATFDLETGVAITGIMMSVFAVPFNSHSSIT